MARKTGKPPLTVKVLFAEARAFAKAESRHSEPRLFGVTDGKAVGTYVEQKFRDYLTGKYEFQEGSSAKGIDFPDLDVDLKVTSIRQPQSSCPFKSAQQKVYGLGYCVLVFVYDKTDDPKSKSARLNILHTIYVERHRTADYQTTLGLRNLLKSKANEEEVAAFLIERNLPLEEIGIARLAQQILAEKPEQGYLTISNALQWRLQYGRVITAAGTVEGIQKLS